MFCSFLLIHRTFITRYLHFRCFKILIFWPESFLALANLKIFSNDGQGVGNKSINPPELVQTTTFIGLFFYIVARKLLTLIHLLITFSFTSQLLKENSPKKFNSLCKLFLNFQSKKSWFYLITSYQITFVIDVLFFCT
jgi:hypothetical protein